MEKKTKSEDEDFERMVREFIDTELNDEDSPDDFETSDDLDDQLTDDMPFPKDLNDKVANAMMKANCHDADFLKDVAKVTVEVGPDYDKNVLWDAPLAVTFHPKSKAYLRQYRFECFIYDEAFYPIINSDETTLVKRNRNKTVTMELNPIEVWIPGRYVLLINDVQDASTFRVDFTIDESMNATCSQPQACQRGGIEEVLVCCMQGKEDYWERMASRPGMAQFRRKALEARQLMLYNECRKEYELDVMNSCENLLICTRNDDIGKYVLQCFQRLMTGNDCATSIDSASFFNLACNNPFEPMNELLDNADMKMLCLTNLKELTGSNGKIIMRRIIEKVREANGHLPFWLCGPRQQIDELLNLYPSLREFFLPESYVEQEAYTAFELVQSFIGKLYMENMVPNVPVKNRLTRAIIQGFQQGVLANWTVADIHRFVVEEIRPRYLRRTMTIMFESSFMLLTEEDIPFDKLTCGSSAFDESMQELNEMIGLENVKQGVMTMSNQARLFIERARRGLKTSSPKIFHCIFTGNPGTGKTTVARKLGKIYRSLGLLSKGEVIAVDRTRLVGQYIGQTEENMKVVLEEAKGNVLFIDEAYTLVTCTEDKKDFGGRVLDSLLTVLTQPNPDMLIVFAGYPKEMDTMLSTNPGLAGRFPFRYHFDDYTAEQLMEIARHLLERDEFILTDEADLSLEVAIEETLERKQPNFGNARWIEQFVNNGIIPAMADRIYSSGSTDLQRIEAADIAKAFEKFKPKANEPKPTRHRVKGFGA